MKEKLKNLEPFWPWLLFAMYFVIEKIETASLVYYLTALVVGIYFFPLRLLIEKGKKKLEYIIQSCTYSMVCCASVFTMVLRGEDNFFLDIIQLVLLLTILVFLFRAFFKDNKKEAILNIGMQFLLATMYS